MVASPTCMCIYVMIIHGYNARDLRISSILSIPEDMKSSLISSDNYRESHYLNQYAKVFIMLY